MRWYPGVTFDIDPDAELVYSWDWSEWLPTGVDIDTYTVTAEDNGATIGAVSMTGNVVSALVSGVAAGDRVSITCTITTDEVVAQTDQRSIVVRGVER